MPTAATAKAKTQDRVQVPQPHNWRTTDEDEVNRRRLRAESEPLRIVNEEPSHPIFATLRVESRPSTLPRELAGLFDGKGLLKTADVEWALDLCRRFGNRLLRVSQEVGPWIESGQQLQERNVLLREYEQRVQSGQWPQQ